MRSHPGSPPAGRSRPRVWRPKLHCRQARAHYCKLGRNATDSVARHWPPHAWRPAEHVARNQRPHSGGRDLTTKRQLATELRRRDAAGLLASTNAARLLAEAPANGSGCRATASPPYERGVPRRPSPAPRPGEFPPRPRVPRRPSPAPTEILRKCDRCASNLPADHDLLCKLCHWRARRHDAVCLALAAEIEHVAHTAPHREQAVDQLPELLGCCCT